MAMGTSITGKSYNHCSNIDYDDMNYKKKRVIAWEEFRFACRANILFTLFLPTLPMHKNIVEAMTYH